MPVKIDIFRISGFDMPVLAVFWGCALRIETASIGSISISAVINSSEYLVCICIPGIQYNVLAVLLQYTRSLIGFATGSSMIARKGIPG